MSLIHSYKTCWQEASGGFGRENLAHCHRIVHKTCKKSEKGEGKKRKHDISSINNCHIGVSVFLTLKARS